MFEADCTNSSTHLDIPRCIRSQDVVCGLAVCTRISASLPCAQDCISHITRIARIMRQPRGNALLVGVGGSGRSSCARLCACMSETAEFEIALTKGYGLEAFREDGRRSALTWCVVPCCCAC